jgi:hypothetical protein
MGKDAREPSSSITCMSAPATGSTPHGKRNFSRDTCVYCPMRRALPFDSFLYCTIECSESVGEVSEFLFSGTYADEKGSTCNAAQHSTLPPEIECVVEGRFSG